MHISHYKVIWNLFISSYFAWNKECALHFQQQLKPLLDLLQQNLRVEKGVVCNLELIKLTFFVSFTFFRPPWNGPDVSNHLALIFKVGGNEIHGHGIRIFVCMSYFLLTHVVRP